MSGRLLRFGYYVLVALTLVTYVAPVTPPTALWPVAFVGLGFPVLLVAHGVYVVYWLVLRRSRLWLVSVGVVLLGWPHVRRIVGWGGDAGAAGSATTFSVANYNLLGGSLFAASHPDTMVARVGELGVCLAGADLIAFEEFPGYPRLADALDSALLAWGFAHAFRPGRLRVAIYSRYPLSATRVLAEYNVTNAALAADVALPDGRTFTFLAAHLESNALTRNSTDPTAPADVSASRRAYWGARAIARNYRAAARRRGGQAAQLAAFVRGNPYPVLLAGDLNDPPQSYALGELRRAGLEDAFEAAGAGLGVTYAGSIPGLRIDYVLATEQLEPVDARTLDCALSDHYPVRASYLLR